MAIPNTCLPVRHNTPSVPMPTCVSGGCDWEYECPPEPYVDGCDCGCPKDPSLLFGPDSVGQVSQDFIVKRTVTLMAVGLPCDAFAVVEQGLYYCGCYVYDDWFRCGRVVRLTRENNRLVIDQPGRFRLKLFNANPSKVYIRKLTGGRA